MAGLYPVKIPPDYSATRELDALRATIGVTGDVGERQCIAGEILKHATAAMTKYPDKAASALIAAGRHAKDELKGEIVNAMYECSQHPNLDPKMHQELKRRAELYTPSFPAPLLPAAFPRPSAKPNALNS